MLHKNILKAALLFAATKDVRHYLVGVCIKPDSVAATDGHRLVIIKTPTGLTRETFVPTEIVKRMMVGTTKKMELRSTGDGLICDGVAYAFPHSKFPDLGYALDRAKGVIGVDSGAKLISADWDYLAKAQQAIRLIGKPLLGVQAYDIFLDYNPTTGEAIPHPALRDLVQVVIMPRRTRDADTVRGKKGE